MNFRRAKINSCREVEELIFEGFAPLPRNAGDVYALVYLIESNEPDGSPVEGFQPGYIATVWPFASISRDWLVGTFSDGTEFYFLPRDKWGVGGDFHLGIIERVTPTYSLVRQ